MKYKIYVVKCELEKYWVSFTDMELDDYWQIIVEGKGPVLTTIVSPLDIFQICETDSLEKAERLNVIVYQILSKVMNQKNVKMDANVYEKICNCKISDTTKSLILTDDHFSSSSIITTKNETISTSDSNEKFMVYSLLCTRNARYIGITKNPLDTIVSHKFGTKSWFTRTYKPLSIEERHYCTNEMDAKLLSIDIFDRLKSEYGSGANIHCEFFDSKNMQVVWEDLIVPVYPELFENTPNDSNTKFWVYVLICEESKYYVGYTSNLRKRFKQHISGIDGASFTYQYPPQAVFHIEGHKYESKAKEAEKIWTLDLKKFKGIENVFGYYKEIYDPAKRFYYGHELLENWIIKNPKVYDLEKLGI